MNRKIVLLSATGKKVYSSPQAETFSFALSDPCCNTSESKPIDDKTGNVTGTNAGQQVDSPEALDYINANSGWDAYNSTTTSSSGN